MSFRFSFDMYFGKFITSCLYYTSSTDICQVAIYTIDPKKRDYSEDTRKLAMKMYYSGVSGRGVGKVLGMSKANVYNWIKKNG